ncbi:MAG: DNA cytosine methyltransferase [Mariprofundaceae bacterium]|nr:DNA cytosine methyltransferase [Mariprofundaceae bacterium]
MNDVLCDLEWLKSNKTRNYMKHQKQVHIVDLFSGCGGLTLGALEGFYTNEISCKVKLAVENNEYSSKIYKDNFKDCLEEMYIGDVEDLICGYPEDKLGESEQKLKENFSNINLVLAGPPCQGHSRLNNHTRSNDPRNKLYLKVIRFVEICKPKYVIIENVLNIKHDKDNILDESKVILENLGYKVQNLTVKIAKYGVAQKRIRHVQIASLNEVTFDFTKYQKRYVLSDVIEDIIDESKSSDNIFHTPSVTKHMERINYLFENNMHDLPNHMRPDCHKKKNHTYPTSYGRLKWDDASTTITRGFSTMGQGRFVHPLRRRTLTPHEASRIQGFPDFFKFNEVKKRGQLHLMIANAVPPKVGAMIINEIIHYENEVNA